MDCGSQASLKCSVPNHDQTLPDPFPRKLQLRAAEVSRLLMAITAATQVGRSVFDSRPDLAGSLLPLLVRLEEIREEIEGFGIVHDSPAIGELYPVWVELTRGRRA